MKDLLKSALRNDFRAFFEKVFAELHGGDNPENAPYIDVLCGFLEDLIAGKFRRGVVNMPPRHLKTMLCTISLTAWLLGGHPGRRVMIVTYGEELSRDIADKIRRILRSKWYQQVFATRLSADRYQVTDFATEQGGGVFATSFGAAITGRGADVIIIRGGVGFYRRSYCEVLPVGMGPEDDLRGRPIEWWNANALPQSSCYARFLASVLQSYLFRISECLRCRHTVLGVGYMSPLPI